MKGGPGKAQTKLALVFFKNSSEISSHNFSWSNFWNIRDFSVYAALLILLKITAVVYFQIILNQYLDSLKSIKPLFVLTQ